MNYSIKLNSFFLILTILFSSLGYSSPKHSKLRSINFKGYLKDNPKALIFKGNEVLQKNGNVLQKITIYKTLDNKALFQDNSSFNNSNFDLISYSVNNFINGSTLEAKKDITNKVIKINETTLDSKQGKKSSYNSKSISIIPKAIHEFTIKHWTELLNKGEKAIPLFIPSKKQSVSLKLKLTTQKNGDYSVRLSSGNFIYRLLIPKIIFIFKKGKVGEVKTYIGPSPFEHNGKTPNIRIEFSPSAI